MVDAGDIFHTSNTLPESQKDAVLAKAKLLLNAYAKQGCVGIGIGDRDLGALGVEQFKAFAAEAKFPVLNANLVSKKDNTPVFTPNVVVERAGVKIGLFGITTGGANIPEADLYALLPPVDAAKEQVAALQKAGAEVVVMLGHLDRRDAEVVAREVPGIDLVLGGQSMGNSRFLERLTDSWYVEPGQKGKHLAIVTLNMPAGGKRPFVVREEASKLKDEIVAVEKRIQRYVKLANGPSRPGTRTANKDRFKGVISSLVRQHEQLVVKAGKISKASAEAPFIGLEMVAMNKKLRDDGEIAGWVTEYQGKYDSKAVPGKGLRRPTKPISKSTRPSRAINHKAIRATGPAKTTEKAAEKKSSPSGPSSKTIKKVVRPK